jgi:inorganic triphosphatase YgiF
MPTEVEARFRADGPERLARLATLPALQAVAGAGLGQPRTFDEVDTYLDTADGALATARWACRLRERDGRITASLKGPPEAPPSSDGIHRRPEVEGPAAASHDPAQWPPSPARDLVDDLRRGDPLVERLSLRQVRTERAVTVTGATLATLSLDTVTVHRHGAVHGRFHVVELELAAGSAEQEVELAELARAVGAEPGLRPDHLSKLEHALELIGER